MRHLPIKTHYAPTPLETHPRSRRLSGLLFLSALALVVGVLGGCGASDSGQDVEPEAAATTATCDAPAAPGVNWEECNKTFANLTGATLTKANLRYANLRYAGMQGVTYCNTTMPDGTVNNANCWPTRPWLAMASKRRVRAKPLRIRFIANLQLSFPVRGGIAAPGSWVVPASRERPSASILWRSFRLRETLILVTDPRF
jgi:hypothetical protein